MQKQGGSLTRLKKACKWNEYPPGGQRVSILKMKLEAPREGFYRDLTPLWLLSDSSGDSLATLFGEIAIWYARSCRVFRLRMRWEMQCIAFGVIGFQEVFHEEPSFRWRCFGQHGAQTTVRKKRLYCEQEFSPSNGKRSGVVPVLEHNSPWGLLFSQLRSS